MAGDAVDGEDSPELINCTLSDNGAVLAGGAGYITDCSPLIKNSILWSNDALFQEADQNNSGVLAGGRELFIVNASTLVSYSCIEGGLNGYKVKGGHNIISGSGNIDACPYFVEGEVEAEKYHLLDYSNCIDAGDPASDYSGEGDWDSSSNSAIDMGAYGNTPDATPASADSDGDELPDSWETLHFLNTDYDDDDDPDGEGLSNEDEYRYGTNPDNKDSDGDGEDYTGCNENWGKDKWEIDRGYDPLTYNNNFQEDHEVTLPYSTSFESGRQRLGWVQELESPSRSYFQWRREKIAEELYFHYAMIGPKTKLYINVNDPEDDHKYVRFKVKPCLNSSIRLQKKDEAVIKLAEIEFTYVQNGYNVRAYTGASWEAKTLIDSSWEPPEDLIVDGPEDFLDVEIRLNFANDEYQLFIGGEMMKYSDGGGEINTFNFQSSCGSLNYLEFDNDPTDEAQYDSMSVDMVSISDYGQAEGYSVEPDVIYDGTDVFKGYRTVSDHDIVNPVVCMEVYKSRVEVKGHLWMKNLGYYEIKYLPWELKDEPDYYVTDANPANMKNWPTAYQGDCIVGLDGTLGFWDTASITNGAYIFGVVVYRDVSKVQYDWHTGEMKARPAEAVYYGALRNVYSDNWYDPVMVMDGQKSYTLQFQEEPDISVPWPGEFPFELRRSFDNSRRHFIKPLYHGWTHNFQITLTENTIANFDRLSEDLALLQNPYYDNKTLGYGDIWITYPSGAKRLFRHVSYIDGIWEDGCGEATSVYYPCIGTQGSGDDIEMIRDKSGDKIKRETVTTGSNNNFEAITYKLYQSDGTVYTFKWEGEIPYDCLGAVGWEATAGVSSISDRLDNTLEIGWHKENNKPVAVASIEWDPDGDDTEAEIKTIELDYDYGKGRYTKAELITWGGGNETVNRTVRYDVQEGHYDYMYYYVTREGKTGYWGDLGYTPPSETSAAFEYSQVYAYDADWKLREIGFAEGDSYPDIISVIDYDDIGQVKFRKDYVGHNYSYREFYYQRPNDDTLEIREFLSSSETLADIFAGRNGKTCVQMTITDQDKHGRLKKQALFVPPGASPYEQNSMIKIQETSFIYDDEQVDNMTYPRNTPETITTVYGANGPVTAPDFFTYNLSGEFDVLLNDFDLNAFWEGKNPKLYIYACTDPVDEFGTVKGEVAIIKKMSPTDNDKILYNPEDIELGDEISFNYFVSDAYGGSSVGTVTIKYDDFNSNALHGAPDYAVTDKDNTADGIVIKVLDNDIDRHGSNSDDFKIVEGSVANPYYGTINIDYQNGIITYKPDGSFTG
ncbi:MAG: hypothetical protein AMJ79_11270, partial [Phycisphaerae bacterium SM23_30]